MNVDAQGMPIRKLLTNGEYIIPDYQREFDWEEQITEFIEDINEIEDNESYFIGHMVFEGKRNGASFVVIDGQQRITTITIILCCLRDIFYAKNENDLANGINDKYIFSINDDNKKFARLKNDMPYPVLQARVQNIPSEKDSNIIPKKNGEKKILSAYDKIYSKFRNQTVDELKSFRDKILNLETVSVVAEGVSNACTIFMTLNSTGKDLTPLDLVKSLIFSKYKSVPLINEPNDTWKKIVNNTKQHNKFLNNFFASIYKKVVDRKIFKEVEKTIKSLNPNDENEGTKVFLEQMLKDSITFKMLNEPLASDWQTSDYDIYESINALIKTFKIQVANSFLIAIVRDYKSKTISKKMCMKALSTMERFHFINNAVCSNRSSGMDQSYSRFAQNLYQAKTKQKKHIVINNVCQYLISRIANLEDFKANIDTKLYYTKNDEKQKELVKYVLLKLERSKNKNQVPIATSIEHIYPETPDVMTLSDPSLIKNIGNLVLLEENINSKIGNKKYADKKTYVMNNSNMRTAKKIFSNYTQWSDKEIKQRRDKLIDEMYNMMWI